MIIFICARFAIAADYFVDAINGNDTNNGTSWATAKQTLEVSVAGKTALDTVWAASGVYNAGSMTTPSGSCENRVVLNGVWLKAKDGDTPIIDGGGLMRCVFMTNNSYLVGFKLINGKADLLDDSSGNYLNNSGGAVFMAGSSKIQECDIQSSEATRGGGIYCREGGTISRCKLSTNSATLYGGGIYFFKDGVVENSFLENNQSGENGGALYFYYGGTCINATTLNNTAGTNGNELDFVNGGTVQNTIAWNVNGAMDRPEGATQIEYTCATDGVTNGINNCFTNNPMLSVEKVPMIGSPCIDSGMYKTYTKDGRRALRVFNGTVDIGATEAPGNTQLNIEDKTVLLAFNAPVQTNHYYLINQKNMPANWEIVSSFPSWLNVLPISGSIDGATSTNSFAYTELDYIFDPTGLTSGSYIATNLFQAPFMENTWTQLVTIVISDADLFIEDTNFQGIYNSTNETLSLILTNQGTAQANWTISDIPDWLHISATQGLLAVSSQTNLLYTADPTGLAPGIYWATNLFDAPTMNGSFTQLVSFTVKESVLTLSNLFFSAAVNSGDSLDQITPIKNIGEVTASWEFSNLPNWLSVSQANGQLNAETEHEIQFTVDSVGLVAGNYLATNLLTADSMVATITQTVTFLITDYDYFVATNGIDSATGTNWATAKQTIQAGIEAQHTRGGIIYVSNGTYQINESINLIGGQVLQSLNGANKTFIDGGNNMRCVYIKNYSTLDGFTISNGHANGLNDEDQSGGGIIAWSSTIRNCVVQSNNAKRVGGGLAAKDSDISKCRFLNNTVDGVLFYGGAGGGASIAGTFLSECIFTTNQAHYGGGLAASNSTVSSSSFYSNQALIDGGGLYLMHGQNLHNLSFVDNEAINNGGALYFNDGGELDYGYFTNNRAGANGGAIYISDNSNTDSYDAAECRYVNLHQNHANHYGGGAYLWHGGMISRSTISSNTANINGGGVMFRLSGGVYRTDIFDNTASTNGGGVYFSEGGYLRESTVSNNQAKRGAGIYFNQKGDAQNILITDNKASVRGGGIYCYKGGTLNGITTTENVATEKGTGFYAYNSMSNVLNQIELQNAIIWESTDPIYRYGAEILLHHICSNESYTNGISELLKTNPNFLDPTLTNYQLSANSPCINAGTNTSTRSYDLLIKPRIMGGVADLGAYEWNFNDDIDDDNLPDAWESEYFGGITNAIADEDSDGDTQNNLHEYIAGTLPHDNSSYLHIIQSEIGVNTQITISWAPSVKGRIYGVSLSTNLINGFNDTEPSNLCYPSDQITLDNNYPTSFYKINVRLNN